jgi:predicted phosphodiesterase
LVLYGHTHIAGSTYRDGVYFVNPGALRASRDGKEGYAIVDINPKGIVTSLMKL